MQVLVVQYCRHVKIGVFRTIFRRILENKVVNTFTSKSQYEKLNSETKRIIIIIIISISINNNINETICNVRWSVPLVQVVGVFYPPL